MPSRHLIQRLTFLPLPTINTTKTTTTTQEKKNNSAMNALDSPLEVFLAADSLLTIINNIWTWVAVIAAAALSLWRIRTSPPPSELAPLITPLAEPQAKAVHSPTPAPRAFNSEGRTSGKFTFYYVREENGGEAVENNAGGGDGDMEEKEEPVRNDWEASMKMRMWDDMGFRSYQDLSVLDGNVVRLWDGCQRRSKVINAVVGGGGYEYNWSS